MAPRSIQKPGRGAQPHNENARTHNIYSKHFTADELSRILDAITDPAAGLDAAIGATYVLLDRIIARIPTDAEHPSPADPAELDSLIKLATAHNETTGRIAHLLRTHRLLTDSAADNLAGHIAGALDELAERLQVQL